MNCFQKYVTKKVNSLSSDVFSRPVFVGHLVKPGMAEHRTAEHGMSEHQIWNSKTRNTKPHVRNLIAFAKSWSVRGASHHPAFMRNITAQLLVTISRGNFVPLFI